MYENKKKNKKRKFRAPRGQRAVRASQDSILPPLPGNSFGFPVCPRGLLGPFCVGTNFAILEPVGAFCERPMKSRGGP